MWEVRCRIANVLSDLSPQRSLANRTDSGLEGFKLRCGGTADLRGELAAEGVLATEQLGINDAYQPVKLHERVLERRGREQDFGASLDRIPNRTGDLVALLVDVSHPVGFVDHDQIPLNFLHVVDLGLSEFIGADDDRTVLIEGIPTPLFLDGFVALRFEDERLDEELLQKLPVPLLAEGSRNDAEDSAFAFGPKLTDDESRLDSLAQADFIGQDRTTGQRRLESEQGRLDLMGIEIDSGVQKRLRELLGVVGGEAPSELMGVVL